MQKGYSVIEMLVVVVVFAILTIVTTQAIFLTLRGSNKSSASIKVRENVDFAMSLIERQLRNAQSIECSEDGKDLSFSDEQGGEITYSCNGGDEGFIASDSARLTSDEIHIDCSPVGTAVFACNLDNPAPSPDSVEINIIARDSEGGVEGSTLTVSTKILLRSY